MDNAQLTMDNGQGTIDNSQLSIVNSPLVPPGYKQTEVGVIPEDWDINAIASITMIVGGGTPRTDVDEYWEGIIPWVSAGDISRANGRYVYDTVDHISNLGLDNCSAKTVPAGTTVIIARGATVGRMAQLNKAMTFNQTCYGLLPDVGIDQNYLYYSMLFSVNSMKALTYGTIFGTITTTSFQQWKIPLPPLAEQEAIAAALSDADALIEALEQLIAKKRQVKQGAMQELLTGKRRLPGFSGEWEKRPLSNLAMVNKGQQLHSTETHEYGRYAHLNGGIAPSSYTDKSNTPGNTIAISEGGNSCGYVQFMSEPFWSGGHCYAVTADGLDNQYLFYALKQQEPSIMGLRVGSGLPNVQKTALLALEVRYPSVIAEQTAIAAILSDMDAEIAALEEKLAKARQVKQGMMQELLTGRTRLIENG